MPGANQSKSNSRQGASERAVRPAVLLPLLLLVLGCVGLSVVLWLKAHSRPAGPKSASPAEPPSEVAAQASHRSSLAEEALPVPVTNLPAAKLTPGRVQVAVARPAPAPSLPRPQPSPYTRQLVNELVNLDPSGAPLSPEQAAAWKQNLQSLIQQGAAAVPAIREFLEKNIDFAFGTAGAGALGYDSARAAMYDALAQIGGPEAAGLLLDTLGTTASPQDIAQLARSLDKMAPGQYRQQIVDAARQALLPAQGQLPQGDVAPLFQVLSTYGGPAALADLGDAASRWKYYSAIALGQLPDGAGVPALVQMLQTPDGGPVRNIPALQMLTQLAAQNPDARAALLQAVQANTISPGTWAYLAPALAGDQAQYLDSTAGGTLPTSPGNDLRTFHIAAGNQNFYTAPPPGGLTADQINQQLSLLDQLLHATSIPEAQQVLQNARAQLLKSTAQPPATPNP